MANLIATYQQWQTTDAAMTASKYPCSRADNIQQLETASAGKQDPEFRCNYSLGERIFLNLLQTIGEVPFREGAQRLYDQSLSGDGGADVEEVRAAFNSPEIVKKWYSGNRPRGSTQVDESPPNWKLEEIHGTISDAEIILAEGKPKITSFSAREHHGYAYFQFKYEHPTFVEESWSVDMTMVETFIERYSVVSEYLANVESTWSKEWSAAGDPTSGCRRHPT